MNRHYINTKKTFFKVICECGNEMEVIHNVRDELKNNNYPYMRCSCGAKFYGTFEKGGWTDFHREHKENDPNYIGQRVIDNHVPA